MSLWYLIFLSQEKSIGGQLLVPFPFLNHYQDAEGSDASDSTNYSLPTPNFTTVIKRKTYIYIAGMYFFSFLFSTLEGNELWNSAGAKCAETLCVYFHQEPPSSK